MEDETYFDRRDHIRIREMKVNPKFRTKVRPHQPHEHKEKRDKEKPHGNLKEQRRMVANFSTVELLEVYSWMEKVSGSFPDLTVDSALETVDGLEARKKMRYGIKALLEICSSGHGPQEVRNVLVWEEPDRKLSVEPRYFSSK